MINPSHFYVAHPLAVIVGPTGVGKSVLALAVARTFGGEVVSCDSLQIYKHFDLGSAKLALPALHGVPHHLIDVADPDEIFTAGEYARRAHRALDEITVRGCLPVIAGGTGFYLRALLDGLPPGPPRNTGLRTTLVRRDAARPGFLHRVLRRYDAPAAARIHPNDRQKLVRAIEIRLLMRGLHLQARATLAGYRAIKVGLSPDRAELNSALNARGARLFGDGLIDEVCRILALGYTGSEKPFEALGYRQALAVVRGEMSEPEAIASTQLATRQYAKRQMTWFRRERDVHWLPGFGHSPEIERQALEYIRQRL